MPLDRLIDTYGYWAILVGTLLEGETILILGGFACLSGIFGFTRGHPDGLHGWALRRPIVFFPGEEIWRPNPGQIPFLAEPDR